MQAFLQGFANEQQIRDSLNEHEINMKWLELHSQSIYDWVEINSSANSTMNLSGITIILSFAMMKIVKQFM